MTPLDIQKALHNRNFFRFTGPPENWLTAIKYMTWGLEEKYRDRWSKIQIGDVFLMHSTTESLFYKNAKSAIVGLGVVGGQLRVATGHVCLRSYPKQLRRSIRFNLGRWLDRNDAHHDRSPVATGNRGPRSAGPPQLLR